jgi:hypothetical protein
MPITAEISVFGTSAKIPADRAPDGAGGRRTVNSVAPQAKEIAYQKQPPRSSRATWKIVQ